MPAEVDDPSPGRSADSGVMGALATLVTVTIAVVPFAVTPDLLDRYRVLKESIVRGEGILAGVLLAAALAFTGSKRFRELLRERAVTAVAAAGVAWAIITATVSTHRVHSIDSLVTMLTCALVFLAAWYAAPRISLLVLDLLVPAVIANVALATVQEYGIYQPFYNDPLLPTHITATGLIDNPNVVGSYMTLAAVTFAAATTAVRGWRRWLYVFGAAWAIGGVLVSQTRTALIALIFGLLLLAVGRSVKRAAVVLAAVAVLFGSGVVLRNPAVMSVLAIPERARTESIEVATSGRAAPIAAGMQMFLDHPVTGVGPGAFKYHFMAYKTEIVQRFPRALRGTTATNFAEVHNDHVQLLAETGLPGYALFLAFIVVGIRAVRVPDSLDSLSMAEKGVARLDVRASAARAIVIPLAGTLLVLCLAQFPLYVPTTRHLLVTLAGLLIGWSRPWD